MNGESVPQPISWQRRATFAVAAAGTLLTGACSTDPQTHPTTAQTEATWHLPEEHTASSTTHPSTTLETLPPTIIPPHVDLCETDNPVTASFTGPDATAKAVWFDLYNKLNAGGDTKESTLAALDRLKTIYGINFIAPDSPPDDSSYHYEPLPADANELAFKGHMMDIVSALENFSPELMRAMGGINFSFVNGITKKPEFRDKNTIVDVAAGLANIDQRSIYIDVSTAWGIEDVVNHELWHMLDGLVFCGPEDFGDDKIISEQNPQEYLGYVDDVNKLPAHLTHPSPERAYAGTYGATSVTEDRATIMEWTIGRRGLILEGDPDWGSPLQRKQAILVDRLERSAPGARDYLLARTKILRNNGGFAELDKFIPNPLHPGTVSDGNKIVEEAVNTGQPLEILHNVILDISVFKDRHTTIENPMVFRDAAGNIKGIAWANEYAGLTAMYFSPISMRFLTTNPASVESVSDTVEVTLREQKYGTSFSPATMSINGYKSGQIIAENGDSFDDETLDSLYPVVLTQKELARS